MATNIRRSTPEHVTIPDGFGATIDLERGSATRYRLAAQRRADTKIYSWPELRRMLVALSQLAASDRAIFFRHGATHYNQRQLVTGQHDTTLSNEGRVQARELRPIVPDDLSLIVCSALFRTVETMELAVPVSMRKNVPIIADARLNEVHLGNLQGRKRRYLPEFDAGDLDFAPPTGETYRQAAQRIFSCIADIFSILADTPGQQTAAVFCHAGVLRIIGTLTHRGGNSRDVFKAQFGNGERLDVVGSNIALPDYWDDLDDGRGGHR